MLSDAVRVMQDDGGVWLCLHAPSLALAKREQERFDGLMDVDIKKHRQKRSLDANAYCWVLLDKLADATGIKKTDIYRSLIREIGGNSTCVCVQDAALDDLRIGWQRNGIGWIAEPFPSKIEGCTNLCLYYGSSTYDTRQMSKLIDLVVEECKAQGIETMPPEQLSALLSHWKA